MQWTSAATPGLLSALLLACAPPGHAAADKVAVQSRASYEDAFRALSSSPSCVLVTVVDARTGQARQVCTNAHFLLGAIHHEFGLGYDAADSAKAVALALQAGDHAFRFHHQPALDDITATYSAARLQAARDFLAPLSQGESKDKFSSLYANRRLDTSGHARDAIACALIEPGLSPKMADISGQVYIEP